VTISSTFELTSDSSSWAGTGYGGLAYIDGDTIDLSISDVTFTDISCPYSGGMFYIVEIQSIDIDDSTFEQLTAEEEGSAFYIDDDF
jgi:hypothetical protein